MKNRTILTIDAIKNKLEPVFAQYEINSCVLFGSYAKGHANVNSDVDLMVQSNLHGLHFFAFIEDIREALDEKEVNVFDVTHIDDGSRVQKEINSTGIKIYG